MNRYVRARVSGIVQGVGFRPFVFRIARENGIKGTVSNNHMGVDIMAFGGKEKVARFLKALEREAPPAAVVEQIEITEAEPFEADSFSIEASSRGGERQVLVSPDLATCDDCLTELFDPSDRRYRYPFINCTNCGPRFTIISDTPYDRPNTSMAVFEMCEQCRSEYEDPSDRRFHAQPNACPSCGPSLWLAEPSGRRLEGDPVVEAAAFLRDGGIVAVKGLGGFQLACDATSDEVVGRLRERKRRYGKPFAVMVRDLGEAGRYCEVSAEEASLLGSVKRPIVLLRERADSPLSRMVAGGLAHQGLFLPYTPLHHLLMEEAGTPLVMTSGNMSEEPIAIGNAEALESLAGIADFFLMHDRDILVRYDDSVSRVFMGREYPLRRARGYAPYPVNVTPPARTEVLAVGPELKNTFCLLRGGEVFLSQHIGDMESAGEAEHFEEALAAMKRLFSLKPAVVAHDMHPEYMTTQMAREMGMPAVEVQHHHAHVVSCMADNGIAGRVLGVAWDGTGYGPDATVWGGEFLLCDERDSKRLAHLYQYPMPGADACIFRIYRMVMGVLSELFEDLDEAMACLRGRFDISDEEARSLEFQLSNSFNSPLTSSAGRMFDVAAALCGLRSEAQYDGQAACQLEAAAQAAGEPYRFMIDRGSDPWVLDTRSVFRELMDDLEGGTSAPEAAGRFHATMARALVDTADALSRETGLKRVALSGGVFQNEALTTLAVEGLNAAGLTPYVHGRVPCNDGGVSLGQAVIAANSV